MPFHPLTATHALPERFTYPFCYEPHPLSRQAAALVQDELRRMTLTEGKMFGVLVVTRADGTLGFLAAYSGLLEGRNDWPWFVPPVYDAQQPCGHFKQTERQITALTHQIAAEPANEQLKALRRQMSEELQCWLFDQYHLLNARGERRALVDVWRDYHCSERIRRRYPLPPGGTGDCCAPKLLQYAYAHGLRPVAMAEFWWGPSSRTDIRQHGLFYPACRGKCKPLLAWMLQGLDVDPDPATLSGEPELTVTVVYADESIVVISKPSGLLSVPGRVGNYSAATLVGRLYPGAMLAHRLDMGTSGLMVAGRNRDTYRELQRQFAERTIGKRYVALLDTAVGPSPLSTRPRQGRIDLPLLADPINRPRQVVDWLRGKAAVTDYELVAADRVVLTPHTGRTHQLRLHCAHADGLGCPIRGDELYGQRADRLYLHAELLELNHPTTGRRLSFSLPPDF